MFRPANPHRSTLADGVQCVPVGELTRVADPPSGYVIVGGGKTALDAICWLLDRGTAADAITWIRPRDTWLLNRKFFQPGDGVMETFEGIVFELEAVAQCDSVEAVYARLEEHGVVFRTDSSVVPTMLKGATLARQSSRSSGRSTMSSVSVMSSASSATRSSSSTVSSPRARIV